MNRNLLFALSGASLLLAFSLSASADTLSPISYSMPNGEYSYVTGYGDNAYSNTSCPGYPGSLCGGLGELTDGLTVPSFAGGVNYYSMVGWGSGEGSSQTISFFFDGVQNFGRVGVHASNYSPAGILLPSSVQITVGADTPQNFTVAPSSSTDNQWLYFDVTGSGSSLDLKLTHATQWLFLDEVTFESAASAEAPEPATWLTVLGAIGCLTLVRRRGAASR